MKRVYLLILLVFAALSGYSQKITLQLSEFNRLDVFGPFEVKLVKSEKERAEINFNGIEKEDIIYEAEKGKLRLKVKNRHYMDEWENDRRKSKYVLVTIYYRDIDEIEAGAGAVVTSPETIKSKYLSIECSMGAEVTLDIVAQKIEAISNMGAIVEMSGRTEHLNVKANMGGVLKAAHLESKKVYVRANMGAEVMVNATEELEASAGFGANVDYIGGSSVRYTSKNFGGEVNRKGN